MTNMYNLVHGTNPWAGVLLEALGLTPQKVPRFRDCYWNGKYICLYTRTGGGNREFYEAPNPDNPDGPWNENLRAVDGYAFDEDDALDSTYATFYYRPSPTLRDALLVVPAADATPEQKWRGVLAKLETGVEDPQTQRVADALRPLLDQLTKG